MFCIESIIVGAGTRCILCEGNKVFGYTERNWGSSKTNISPSLIHSLPAWRHFAKRKEARINYFTCGSPKKNTASNIYLFVPHFGALYWLCLDRTSRAGRFTPQWYEEFALSEQVFPVRREETKLIALQLTFWSCHLFSRSLQLILLGIFQGLALFVFPIEVEGFNILPNNSSST